MSSAPESASFAPPVPSASPASVEAVRVCRSFDVAGSKIQVLVDVSLKIYPGEKLFLTGASGAGKTTLLYTLAGLEAPSSGKVLVGGDSLYALPKVEQARIRNQRMGYIYQHFFLLPEFTALENVLMPAYIGKQEREEQARAALESVGLGARTGHLPAELSGGEQQRVALARALVNDPEIIFADEPTGNLDSRTGSAVIDLLLRLVDDYRKTLIVVTHDSTLAERGDRQLVISDGRIVS